MTEKADLLSALRHELADEFEVTGPAEFGAAASHLFVGIWRRRKRDVEVVIKVLPASALDSSDEFERYQREVAALREVRHPNLVRARSGGIVAGRPYLVLERVFGVDLAETLVKRTCLPAEEVVPLIRDVAGALAALHASGRVHRDLKPANIMVLSSGGACLVDLGLARSLEPEARMTSTGIFIGTPPYAAPDQVLGTDVDPRDDVYSLGVVAYEALTGANPFASDDIDEALRRQVSLPVPPLATAAPDTPRDLANFIERMLEKDRSRRPESAAAVGERLREVTVEAELSATFGGAQAVDGTQAVSEEPPVRKSPRGARRVLRKASAKAWRRGSYFAWLLVAVGGLALLVGERLGRTPPPSRATLVEEDGRSGAPSLATASLQVREVLKDLRELEAAGGLLADGPGSLDPLEYEALFKRLPALSAWGLYLRRGADPEQLSAATKMSMRAVDQEFRSLGLLGPFHPVSSRWEVERVPRPVDWPPGPPRLAPWTNAAVASFLHLQEILEPKAAEALEYFRGVGKTPVFEGTPGQRLGKWFGRRHGGSRRRAQMAQILEPVAEEVRSLLYATGRSLHSHEASGIDLARWLLEHSHDWALLVRGPLVGFAPERLMGRALDSAPLRLIGARILLIQAGQATDPGPARRRARELATDAMRALAQTRTHHDLWIIGAVYRIQSLWLSNLTTPTNQVLTEVRARDSGGPDEAFFLNALLRLARRPFRTLVLPPDFWVWADEVAGRMPSQEAAGLRAMAAEVQAKLKNPDAEPHLGL